VSSEEECKRKSDSTHLDLMSSLISCFALLLCQDSGLTHGLASFSSLSDIAANNDSWQMALADRPGDNDDTLTDQSQNLLSWSGPDPGAATAVDWFQVDALETLAFFQVPECGVQTLCVLKKKSRSTGFFIVKKREMTGCQEWTQGAGLFAAAAPAHLSVPLRNSCSLPGTRCNASAQRTTCAP